MRLVYLIPGAISRGPLGAAELERRQAVLQRAAFPGTQVTVADVPDGPLSIESASEAEVGLTRHLGPVFRSQGFTQATHPVNATPSC